MVNLDLLDSNVIVLNNLEQQKTSYRNDEKQFKSKKR